jgi:ribosomal protein L37AE/L43A
VPEPVNIPNQLPAEHPVMNSIRHGQEASAKCPACGSANTMQQGASNMRQCQMCGNVFVAPGVQQ